MEKLRLHFSRFGAVYGFIGGVVSTILTLAAFIWYGLLFYPLPWKATDPTSRYPLGFNKEDAVQNERNEMDMNDNIKVPPTKMPPISANVDPLLRSLLERVWVTKYYGASSELIDFSKEMSFCETWPGQDLLRFGAIAENRKNFMWMYTCLPVEIKWKKTTKI